MLGLATVARHARLDRPRALAYSVAVRSKDLADGALRPDDRAALLRDLAALEATRRVPTSSPTPRRCAPSWRPRRWWSRAAGPGRDRGARPAEATLLPRWLHRILLAAGSALLGLLSLVGLVVLSRCGAADPDTQIVLDDQVVPPGTRPPMLVVASAGEAVVGVLLLVAAVALVVGRDRTGVRLGRIGLVVALAGVNVALGYLDAELVVAAVVAELALLAVAARYRTRFLS